MFNLLINLPEFEDFREIQFMKRNSGRFDGAKSPMRVLRNLGVRFSRKPIFAVLRLKSYV